MMPAQARRFADAATAAFRELLDDDSRSHADLARAVKCLVALRNRLIEDRRQGLPVAGELDEVNSLLSLGFGAEYPLVGFHRQRIEQVCARLAKLNDP